MTKRWAEHALATSMRTPDKLNLRYEILTLKAELAHVQLFRATVFYTATVQIL